MLQNVLHISHMARDAKCKSTQKAFFCIHVKRKELTEQGILAGIYVEADPVSWEVADGFLLSPIFLMKKSESGTRGK